MNYKTFIIYNGDEYTNQESARESGNYSLVGVDMDNEPSVDVLRQMRTAMFQEAGHVIVEEEITEEV